MILAWATHRPVDTAIDLHPIGGPGARVRMVGQVGEGAKTAHAGNGVRSPSARIAQSATSPQVVISFAWYVTFCFATMFVICMLCHGELFRLRPQPRYLTGY